MKSLLSLVFIFFSSLNILSYNPVTYVATAYCLKGRMANGRNVHQGAIAVDRRLIPLGSKVWVNGVMYTASDTGGGIIGNRIDIWMPSCSEARKFGRRKVNVRF
mgnify:CR=1 FL=1